MPAHIESFPQLAFEAGKIAGAAGNGMIPVVVHCQDATYPIIQVHQMPDGAIGLEIALHETGEACNCDDDGVALTSVRHPAAFDVDAEVPGIHTELDLHTGHTRIISKNEEILTDWVTRHFKEQLGHCEGACTWHRVFGWAPEAGCPVHDPDG